MKTTINLRLRRLLMACFTSLILATASSLHAAEGEKITHTNTENYPVSGEFKNLTSSGPGGAILNGGSTGQNANAQMTIAAGTLFSGNTIVTTDTTSCTGGAIFNSGQLMIEDGTADEYTVFSDNSTIRGGAIYQYSTGSLEIGDYTQFNNNTSTVSGSVIHARGGFTIGDNVSFTGNTAAWGGAIYTELKKSDSVPQPDNTVVTIGNHVSFIDNKGGGIFHSVETMNIGNDATFSGNTDISYGAAIYNVGSMSIGTNAEFSSNSVNELHKNGTGLGGAILNVGTMTIESGALFSTNDTIDSGGAIANTATMTITDATFTGNSATNSGGAIVNGAELIYNVTENITNTGNTAAAGGFLMAGAGSTTTFDIAEGATLTIGTGTDANDSIASVDTTATIIKTGTGTMDVKSSMEGYTGSLDVQAGTMTIEGALNASSITVATGASLSSANYTISASDTQGIITEKEGMDSAITGEGIKNMSFSNTAVTFESLHLDNSDIASSSVSATDILVTGESSLTTSELKLDATGIQITLNDNANLTLCAHTAAQLASGSIRAVGDASSTKVTLTATTWTVSGGVATQQMTREGGTLTTYAYSTENTSLTGLTTEGTKLLLDDQLTIELTAPAGLQPREEFLFTLELIGIDDLAAGADLSNIKVSMGIYSGTITGTTTSAGGNLVLEGKIIPEPSTATLSLLALAGLLARRRRQAV